ncbi:YbaB/EbfC family DNA-binding protein [Mycolicibacterium litorale]|uniref:YbaB/EbfC family DNA-binding protein n=1 Tax=Mycolicibacterium litorale TaxID=758802 RepID=UPI003CF61C97
MVGDSSPYEPDDEVDNLSALDFYQPVPSDDESDLAALDAFVPYVQGEDDAVEPEPLFTVTNPPGTVTVSAHLDGRVQHIELSPRAAHMSERELAEEIVVIADLATLDAKSAQYMYMLDGMREQGHDDPVTRDFLQRDLDLPTPEEARARRAEVFATRYAGSHE